MLAGMEPDSKLFASDLCLAMKQKIQPNVQRIELV